MTASPCRSDEIQGPGWNDLDTESLDPNPIRTIGISSPHGVDRGQVVVAY